MKINFRTMISIKLLMAVTLACGGTIATSTADPANAINTSGGGGAGGPGAGGRPGPRP